MKIHKGIETYPIPNLKGCYISRCGRVFRNGREAKQSLAAVGYYMVKFSFKNKTHNFYVHRLLMLTFCGPQPSKKHEVRHLNGDRTDNRLENLRWGTRSENMQDAIRHGTATVGHRNKNAKLRKSDIGWIVDMKKLGFFNREIAKHFKVSPTTIARVVNRTSYKGDCYGV